MNKTKHNFSISVENLQTLRKLKETTGAPMAYHLDEALKDYFNKVLYGVQNEKPGIFTDKV